MRRLPIALVLLVASGFAVAAPVVMASSHCMAMSAMCEGPCVTTGAVSGPDRVTSLQVLTPAPPLAAEHVAQATPQVADPPPKPRLPSA